MSEDLDSTGNELIEDNNVSSGTSEQINAVNEIDSSVNGIVVSSSCTEQNKSKRKMPSWMFSQTENNEVDGGKRVRTCESTTPEVSYADSTQENRERSNENGEYNGSGSSTSNSNNAVKEVVIKTEPEDEYFSTSHVSSSTIAQQEASSSTRETCRFGIRCYRQNLIHRTEMAHPGDNDYRRPNYPPPPAGSPDCPYGNRCYRRNPVHFETFSHPPSTNFKKNRKERKMQIRKKEERKMAATLQNNQNIQFDDDEEDEDPFFTDTSDEDYTPSDDDDYDDYYDDDTE